MLRKEEGPKKIKVEVALAQEQTRGHNHLLDCEVSPVTGQRQHLTWEEVAEDRDPTRSRSFCSRYRSAETPEVGRRLSTDVGFKTLTL